jgi:hypothetical protein
MTINASFKLTFHAGGTDRGDGGKQVIFLIPKPFYNKNKQTVTSMQPSGRNLFFQPYTIKMEAATD